MIFLDENGDELQEIIPVSESEVDQYTPVTHALAVIKAGEDYLMGFNHWQKAWEIFGGCIEEGETGGLFGITLREGELEKILKSNERDEEEIEKVSLYKSIPKGEKIAGIDEKLLGYWK